METRKDIYEVVPDREIRRQKTVEVLGEHYEQWIIDGNVWGDQVENLLENGFMVSMLNHEVVVNRALPISPEQKMENKKFWRALEKAIDDVDRDLKK